MTQLPCWLDRDAYPFEPRRFATPDGYLSYLDEGEGPVVLLVHGTPSWSFEFRHVVRELSKDHRCIAVDHLGFGLSETPMAAPLTPDAHSQRLALLVRALGLRDMTLIVHDFGGPIGLPLALGGDGLVKRVIVLNTWMWPSEGDRTIARIDRLVRSWLGRFLYRWLGFSARVILPSAFGVKSRLTKSIHAQYLAPLSTRADREGTYAFALALKGGDPYYSGLWSRREALSRIPMTIVWGTKDPALSLAYLEKWLRFFPRSRTVRLDDCGHFVAEERPDAVIDAVRGGP